MSAMEKIKPPSPDSFRSVDSVPRNAAISGSSSVLMLSFGSLKSRVRYFWMHAYLHGEINLYRSRWEAESLATLRLSSAN